MNNEITLTESDISSCVFALSKIQDLHKHFDDISDAQKIINESLALSATEKLLSSQLLSNNELRVLYGCITFCNSVCHDLLDKYPRLYKECMPHFFTLNKLDKTLSSVIPDSYL